MIHNGGVSTLPECPGEYPLKTDRILKHPLSGAIYTANDDGTVEVENNGVKGLFHYDGRHISGDIRQADPHMSLWLAGPQLPDTADTSRRFKATD